MYPSTLLPGHHPCPKAVTSRQLHPPCAAALRFVLAPQQGLLGPGCVPLATTTNLSCLPSSPSRQGAGREQCPGPCCGVCPVVAATCPKQLGSPRKKADTLSFRAKTFWLASKKRSGSRGEPVPVLAQAVFPRCQLMGHLKPHIPRGRASERTPGGTRKAFPEAAPVVSMVPIPAWHSPGLPGHAATEGVEVPYLHPSRMTTSASATLWGGGETHAAREKPRAATLFPAGPEWQAGMRWGRQERAGEGCSEMVKVELPNTPAGTTCPSCADSFQKDCVEHLGETPV